MGTVKRLWLLANPAPSSTKACAGGGAGVVAVPRLPYCSQAMASSSDLLDVVREVAREAGDMALRYFRSGLTTSARIWSKAGGSPVTEADIAVDTFLKVRLSEVLPDAGWLSEETADDPQRLDRKVVWIVDPIDGTRAFLSGSHDWSVAIALLESGRPQLGIVHAPAHRTLFEAVRGGGARRNGEAITASAADGSTPLAVAGPKPIVDRLEGGLGALHRPPRIPSLALRISRAAEGSIDAALVSSDARDWDIAAADLILHEAGGVLSDLEHVRPTYNRPDPRHGELVGAPARLHPRLIAAMTGGRLA
jgi:myo-inositol-1(or 4)-monophosphatase